MHLECHVALGWIIANVGGGDRRIRNYTVISAILSDIDAIPYVISPYHYALYHHTFGHNVFLWALWSFLGLKRFGSWKAGILGFIAFGSHLLTDAYLSNWFLYLFWPISRKGYLPELSVELSSPINTYLVYATPFVLFGAALVWKRTPLEWINPKLDQLFLSYFQKKTSGCYVCTRGANALCEECQRPICPRHLRVISGWQISCPGCQSTHASQEVT